MCDRPKTILTATAAAPTPTPRVSPSPWWVTARRVLAVATALVGVLSALVEVLERIGVVGRP